MYRGKLLFLAVFVTVLFIAGEIASAAAKRVAVVIGNGVYQHTSALTNPANDAELIAQVLRAQGFEVDQHINADQKKMKRAIANMANKAATYGTDTVVFFYYAGHGVQVGKTNYLIPVDAKIDTESDVKVETVNVDDLPRVRWQRPRRWSTSSFSTPAATILTAPPSAPGIPV